VAGLERVLFGSQAWTLEMLVEELTGPGRTYYAAVIDDELVGYAGLRFDGDNVDVMTIGTRPAYQRSGVGRTLLCTLVDKARQLGAAKVFLEVAVDNAPALHLYESEGFRRINRRRGYYQGTDAWTMALKIQPIPPQAG
ncbi:MAG: ribosomal protein S18-alanine N-acetyltransferase, partial [Micrococcales bacterium]|nr:ribosomal protein S18-alanine N-acetyltransferase [Micrococcales bacterium]